MVIYCKRGNPPQPSLIKEGEDPNSSPDKGRLGGVASLENKESEGVIFIPYKQKLISRAREFRKEMTKAEQKIWFEILRNKDNTGFKFTRQKPLGEFIADFYCSKLLLVIEIDGNSHDGFFERDKERTNYLKEKFNIKVIRYTNDDVLNNINSVYDNLIENISIRLREIKNHPDKGDIGVINNKLGHE